MGTKPCLLDQTATWYRDTMAWPVDVVEDRVVLPLGRGTVAFDIPGHCAGRVRKRLEHNGFCTPALLLMSARESRAVFLAECDHVVLGQYQMPERVRYLCAPAVLPLPTLTAPMPQHGKWFCAPDPAQRWLYTAAAGLSVINDVTPPQQRSSVDIRPRPVTKARLLVG